jgi:hypothetical protein
MHCFRKYLDRPWRERTIDVQRPDDSAQRTTVRYWLVDGHKLEVGPELDSWITIRRGETRWCRSTPDRTSRRTVEVLVPSTTAAWAIEKLRSKGAIERVLTF